MPSFIQAPPALKNQFTSDPWLQSFLKWRMPKNDWAQASQELEHLGQVVVGEMLEWAWDVEKNPPRHVTHDPWGNRIDQVETDPAWDRLAEVAAREGVVATAYERKLGPASRLLQMSKLYLYHPSSGLFSCPLAMTDGAARILELLAPSDLKERAFKALTSRDPKKFWTSGQWMTERSGGSDVSGTETVAKASGEQFKLHGTKWFTSAVTSQMSVALAREEGLPPGSKGLSLFYIELRKSSGALNDIEVLRLKDKLGTRGLPTAELELKGTPARRLGEPGQGVKNIATMLNITRLYNSICAIAQMRRALALWHDYSSKRVVFGQPMMKQPLFEETFLEQLTTFAGNFAFTMTAVELLGKEEANTASESDKHLLRILTPLVKLFTGKHAVGVTSEVVEGFGGAGYIEDTRLPVLLRDAQVFPIWEGPTNVLSLDLLRVMQKPEPVQAYFASLKDSLKVAGVDGALAKMAESQIKELQEALARKQSQPGELLQTSARRLAFYMSELYAGVKLLEWTAAERASSGRLATSLAEVSQRWWRRPRPWLADDAASTARVKAAVELG